jgi:hypothetical protein
MPHKKPQAAQPRQPITDRRQYWFMVGHDINLCRTEFRSTHERVQALLRAAVRAGETQ